MAVERDNPSEPFGVYLRRLREGAGLSQEELGEKAGLTGQAVGALERGVRQRPYPETVRRLADALGLSDDARAALIAAVPRRTPAGDPASEPAPGAGAAPAGDGGPGDPGAPAPSGLAAPPAPLTALLGREGDVAAALDLLRGGARLLTLTGPGGVGKTRLAVALAREAAVADQFPDGVAFVPLAPLADAALVLPTIAHTLGLREAAGQPLDVLRASLHAKRLLLVLDNCEHVPDAAPEILALLEGCPRLAALTTSRAPLRVRGEQEYPVAPLALPGLAQAPTPDEVAASPAARLFVERARAARPTFALTRENAAAVAAICRRLDGLPLALELAATRVKLLPPMALLARLDRALPLLSRGARDLPERQRTMRDTIAWSYHLLDDAGRTLLRRASVFAGSWTVEAAEAVCVAPSGEARLPDGALAGLAALVDHSLVVAEGAPAGKPRFRLLETIRAYALECLAVEVEGEEEAARQAHAAFFLALVEAADPYAARAPRDHALPRLEADTDNLRAALAWATGESGNAALGLRLAGASAWYWLMRGDVAEGRAWMERALAHATFAGAAGRTAARGRVLLASGGFAWAQGDHAAARARLDESITLLRAAGDRARLARALISRGQVAASLGDARTALALFGESLAQAWAAGDRWWEAYALANQGDATVLAGDPAAAEALYRESLARFDALDNPWGRSIPLTALARLVGARGDERAARALYAEGAAACRAAGDTWGLAHILVALGHAALRSRDMVGAREAFGEGLTLWQGLGLRSGILMCLAGLAGVAARGQPARSARLFAAAPAQVRTVGLAYAAADEADRERAIAAVRARLDAATFAAAWEEGQAMTLEQAIAEARAVTA